MSLQSHDKIPLLAFQNYNMILTALPALKRDLNKKKKDYGFDIGLILNLGLDSDMIPNFEKTTI